MKNLIFQLSAKLKNRLSSGNGPELGRKRIGVGSADLCRFTAVLVMFFSLCIGNVWGAALGTGYTKITSITTLAAGDKVVLYCDDNSEGVTGYSGSDATVSTTEANWIQFSVEKSSNNYFFKTGTYYIKKQTSNKFTIDATSQSDNICTVNGSGVLCINSRYLYKNSSYYRMYTSAQSSYKAFYVYRVDASCDPLTMSAVTAAPGNGSISLSWVPVDHADSYTVTCKKKSDSSTTGIVIGSVSGSNPKTCSITGLTNGTEYTWSVMPVGSSTYCAENTPATGDATPNIYYTVTWNTHDGQFATTSIVSGQKPTFPKVADANPTSCDTGEGASTTFYGWATATWSGKAATLDDSKLSAITIYTNANDMPTVTGNGTVYYAVFCKGGDQGSITISGSDLKTDLGGSYGSGSFSKSYGGNSYTFNTYACVQNSTFQMRNSDSYIQIPSLPGAITNISSSACNNAGTGNYNGTLRLKSAFAAGNTETNDIATKAINATSFSWDISTSATSGFITTSAGLRLSNLTIYFGTEGTNFMTSCCTPLASINGSFFLITYSNRTFVLCLCYVYRIPPLLIYT